MSSAATKWAWQQSLKPTAKLVLLSLADRARDTGECWPSVARLCLNTGLNRKTVMGYAAELEKIGLLTIVKKNGSGNKYQLKIPEETWPALGA